MATAKIHTLDFISKRISYNPVTGLFFWKSLEAKTDGPDRATKIFNKKYAAKRAGTSRNNSGYYVTAIQGRHYLMHRLAWLISYGSMPDGIIDHINGDKLDNRLCNLRVVSDLESARNRPTQANNTTGICGITKRGEKWVARISVRKSRISLGSYSCIGQAIAARRRAMAQHGFHENHGRQMQ